jgi:hypothetical protein
MLLNAHIICKHLEPVHVNFNAYTTCLKNWFLTASAFFQNSHLHSRLVHAQWSLVPDQNFEKPSCQIPNFSNTLCISLFDLSKVYPKQVVLEPIPIKSFSRFLGSFEPIFDSNFGVNIRKLILTPKFESKIGQNNPKNRRKILPG